jgi:2-desacetyl-2-hydroxyethyl bacteriochlorophyllide A dehydrogenase
MISLICTAPGSFEYKDTGKPVLQKGRSILKIRRVGICGTDLHAFEGTQPYFSYPRILGHELAADIVEIDGHSDFNAGDKVTILPYFSCGVCIACRNGKTNCCVTIRVAGVHTDGGMEEYYSVPSNYLVAGQGLDYDELALVEPLAIGAHGIKRAGVQEGETVLIVGAGPIGIAAIEFAIIAGAKVILMDVNENRLSFCRQNFKIAEAINPLHGNTELFLKDFTNGDMPQVIIDATGNQQAINNSLQYLAHGGRYVLIGLQKKELIFSHPEFHKRETTLMSSRNATKEDFETVIASITNGMINPLTYISHRLPFDQVKNEFPGLLRPEKNVIKAIIDMPG